MSADPIVPAVSDDMRYSFRPSLLGSPREFKLTDDGIEWTAGGGTGLVSFRDILRVRMSFKPASMQSQRYVTEVWARGSPKLTIVSSSWKSMVEQERLDRPYSAFVAELHRRIGRTGEPVVFEQGVNALIYWPGLAVFLAVTVAIAALLVRGLLEGAFAGAAFVAAFLGFFVWQSGSFMRRNRPGRYDPDALPAALLPGA